MPPKGLRLANFFINQGTLATLEGQKFPAQTFAADPSKFITGAPLAVLVNRGTYGAAELTADAIEGAKRGDVVGERTFGEGSVQKTIELPDGGALMLTVAKYRGPRRQEDSGRCRHSDRAGGPGLRTTTLRKARPSPKGRRAAQQGTRIAQSQKRITYESTFPILHAMVRATLRRRPLRTNRASLELPEFADFPIRSTVSLGLLFPEHRVRFSMCRSGLISHVDSSKMGAGTVGPGA